MAKLIHEFGCFPGSIDLRTERFACRKWLLSWIWTETLNFARFVEVITLNAAGLTRSKQTSLMNCPDQTKTARIGTMNTLLPSCYYSDSSDCGEASELDHNNRQDLPLCPGRAPPGTTSADKACNVPETITYIVNAAAKRRSHARSGQSWGQALYRSVWFLNTSGHILHVADAQPLAYRLPSDMPAFLLYRSTGKQHSGCIPMLRMRLLLLAECQPH